MDRIYEDANDKNVATVVIYAKKADKKLFYDAELKKAVPAEDCLNLFMKGVVAKLETTYYRAVKCTEAGVIDFGFPS